MVERRKLEKNQVAGHGRCSAVAPVAEIPEKHGRFLGRPVVEELLVEVHRPEVGPGEVFNDVFVGLGIIDEVEIPDFIAEERLPGKKRGGERRQDEKTSGHARPSARRHHPLLPAGRTDVPASGKSSSRRAFYSQLIVFWKRAPLMESFSISVRGGLLRTA